MEGRKEGRGEDWIGRGYGDGGWGERRGEVDTPTTDPLTGGHTNNISADGLRLRTNRIPEDRFMDGEAQGHLDLEIRRFQMKPEDLWAKMTLIFWIG